MNCVGEMSTYCYIPDQDKVKHLLLSTHVQVSHHLIDCSLMTNKK